MMMRLGWCKHCGLAIKDKETFNWVTCRRNGDTDLVCGSCLSLRYKYSPNGDCILKRD